MKCSAASLALAARGRAPHGARGLKFHNVCNLFVKFARRAPHGARGLKLLVAAVGLLALCRAPHGARGLKLNENGFVNTRIGVAPRTGRVD